MAGGAGALRPDTIAADRGNGDEIFHILSENLRHAPASPGRGSEATPAPRKVALLIEMSNSYARELLQGVQAWVRENGGWTIRLTEQGRGAAVPAWLRSGWDGHGVIARVESPAIARRLRATGLPVIDVSAALPRLVFPRVATEAAGVAGLAADHLAQRGFASFAYCGDRRYHWTRRRGEAFAAAVRQLGGT